MPYFEVKLVNSNFPRARPVWIYLKANDREQALIIAKDRCQLANNGFCPTQNPADIKEMSESEYCVSIQRLLS